MVGQTQPNIKFVRSNTQLTINWDTSELVRIQTNKKYPSY